MANRKIIMSSEVTKVPSKRKSSTTDATDGASITEIKDWSLRECCWICQYWRQMTFSTTVARKALKLYRVNDSPMIIQGGDSPKALKYVAEIYYKVF